MRLFWLTLGISFFTFLSAQISEGGTPPSILNRLKKDNIPVFETPEIDIKALKAEDEVTDLIKDIPWRYGYIHYTKLSFNDGVYKILPDGSRLWRIKISSPQAQTLNLTFSQYKLNIGSKLFIYNKNYSKVLGAFTEKNNKESGYLTTSIIEGNELTIELYEPVSAIGKNKLVLERIVQGYRTLEYQLKDVGDSGPCNNNVICPEGDPWRDQIRSVGILLVQNDLSAGFCSGALINNACSEGQPFFLTANHCMDGTDPATISVGFNFESTQCNNNSGPYPTQTISGATQRANHVDSDFYLMELSSSPPASYNVYYSGWDRSGQLPTSQVGIHHPAGDVKKISIDNQGAVYNTFNGADCWNILDWEDGTTEGGSSGSPLFNQNGLIIGQLYGGVADCSNSVDDFYGRFDVSWDRGTSLNDNLQIFLDPCGSNVMQLDGYDPNFSNFNHDAQLIFKNIPPVNYCGKLLPHVLIIRNKGQTILQSAQIHYMINGQANIYNWSGSLAFNEFDEIVLDTILLSSGTNNYQAYIEKSNGTADENVVNDTSSFVIDVTFGYSVKINLKTNYAASENSFIITDQNNNTIESESSFSVNSNHIFEYCMPFDEEFCFTIYDTGGNGLDPVVFNLDQGNLYLEVDGKEIYNSPDIEDEYSYCFSVEEPEFETLIKETSEVNFNMYPNPGSSIITIKSPKVIQEVIIFSINGINVLQSNIKEETHHINCSSLAKGIYVVRVKSEESLGYKKLIIE